MNFSSKHFPFYRNLFTILQVSKQGSLVTRLRVKSSLNGQEFKKMLDFLIETSLIERIIIKKRRKIKVFYQTTDTGKILLSFLEEEEQRRMLRTLRK